MDPEIKAALDEIKGGIDFAKKALEGQDNQAEKLAALDTKLADLTKQVTEHAQKKAAFNLLGTEPTQVRTAVGETIKALHAAKLAGVDVRDLKNVSEARLAGLGYSGESKEIGLQMVEKTAQYGSDASGGIFIPNEVLANDWVEYLRANPEVIFAAGAKKTVLPAGTAGMILPRKTAVTATSIIAENAALGLTDMGWEGVTTKIRRAGGIVPISKSFLFAAPYYVDIAWKDLQKTIALQQQYQAFYGVGANGETTGIANDPKVTKWYLSTTDHKYSGALTGARFRLTDIANLEDVLATLNARLAGAAMVTHPHVIANMKKERNAAYSGDTIGMQAFSFMPGDTLLSDKQLTEALAPYTYNRLTDIKINQTVGSASGTVGDIFFGQFDNIHIFEFGGVQMQTSDQASMGNNSAFATSQVFLKADVNFDVLIRNPLELVQVPDVLTTVASVG
jgi:HK97 family phage major capsid protein